MELWSVISAVSRVVHIVASVCWAGGAFVQFLFIEPTAKATGPEGNKFMQHLMSRSRFAAFMSIASTLTVLSGVLLVWYRSAGNVLAWAQTGPGLALALGAVAGIVVFMVGMFGIRPRAIQISRLGAQIQTAGGPPTTFQVTQLQKLGEEMSRLGLIDFALVAVALLLMVTARYWQF